MHPVESYITKIVGMSIAEVLVGPSGFHLCFPRDGSVEAARNDPKYSLWVRCPIYVKDNSQEAKSDDWIQMEEIHQLPGLINEKVVMCVALNPVGCELELELDSGITLKLVPSTQDFDMPWSIFDYSSEKDYSFSVFSDYFEGYWALEPPVPLGDVKKK